MSIGHKIYSHKLYNMHYIKRCEKYIKYVLPIIRKTK